MFFRRNNEQPVPHAELMPYLQRYGTGCLAYSTLQQGLSHYLEPGIGYIAYLDFHHWLYAPLGRRIVLADPLCAPDQVQGMLERFIARYQRVVVLQCSAVTGGIMETLGYEVNHFGQIGDLPIPFELAGKERAKLRQWRNKCEREGVRVEEVPLSACDMTEISALSAEWIQDKGDRELLLLTRPFVPRQEKDVRYFWARQQGRLIGLAIFDPVYQDEHIIGYYHNFDRITAQAPNGTSAFIILEAIRVFEAEGCQRVSLGLMPLFVLRRHFRHNEFTMKALRYAYRRLNNLYPFQGNVSHKKKFNPIRSHVYFSSTQGNRLWELAILMKAMKML
ncbi:MAG TPA: DUF2156 domain-containing protein [Thiolinea sp.]|nr:DUF2156 domain-containing protein [Thiolinea sp.]